MKKDTLYNLYDNMTNITKDITDLLGKIKELHGNSEKIFYDICINHYDLITEDNIQDFLQLSHSLKLFYNDKELIEMINAVLNNDYIVCDSDFYLIIENIIYILDLDVYQVFDCNLYEETLYYKSYLAKSFLNVFKNYNIYEENIYKHNLKDIINSYYYLLENLNDTEVNINEEENVCLTNRINLFVDIISDKEVYSLDDDKYLVILKVCSELTNLNDLKKIKKIIIRNKDRNFNDFIDILDSNIEEVTECTNIRLYRDLNIKRTENDNSSIKVERLNDDSEIEKNNALKVLKYKYNPFNVKN